MSKADLQDSEEAARQAEVAFDRAYEEMDAEIERESSSCAQSVQKSKRLTVTIVEVTDEEATDKELSEEELLSSPAVLPLGTSDLDVDVESIYRDEHGIHSDRPLSLHVSEPESSGGDVVVNDVEEALAMDGEQPKEALQVIGSDELGPSLPPPDMAAPEASGSSISEPSIHDTDLVIDLEESPDEPLIFPPADFVNTAVEVEHEQQQLPTPPAEQEAFLHRSSVKDQLLYPETLLDATAPRTTVEEGAAEGTSAIPLATSEYDEGVDNMESLRSSIRPPPPETKTDSACVNVDARSANPTTILGTIDIMDVTVQDATDYLGAVPDAWQGIVDEVMSVASNEEPVGPHEQHSTDAYSKEGSVVSLSAIGSYDATSPSYEVEEALGEEVTDDDADGEVDPDISVGQAQNDGNSRELKDAAGEISKDHWYASELPFSADDAATSGKGMKSHAPYKSRTRLTTEVALVETKSLISNIGQVADEDDIASSREGSPLTDMPLTRSPSLTVDPKNLMAGSLESIAPMSPGSETDLYEAGAEFQTDENVVESYTSEIAGTIEQTATPEEASPTIPGLTLAALRRTSSPIPGLGAPLSEDATLVVIDGEIPGLTWSKTFPSLAQANKTEDPVDDEPLQLASSPQEIPSINPSMSKVPLDWSTSNTAFLVQRRATEPVLFSDPYPYSLSTPGLDNVKEDGEDTEEDLEEPDMSMSSFSTSASVDKDLERENGEAAAEKDQNVTGISPGARAPQNHISTNGELPATEDVDPLAQTQDTLVPNDADQDKDADGDLDPDFVQLRENVTDDNDEKAGSTKEPLKATGLDKIAASDRVDVPSQSDNQSDNKIAVQLSELTRQATGDQLAKPDELSSTADVQVEPLVEVNVQVLQEPGAVTATEFTEVKSNGVGKSPEELLDSNNALPNTLQPKTVSPTAITPTTPPRETRTFSSQPTISGEARQNGKRKRSPSPRRDTKTTRMPENVIRHQSPDPNVAKRPRTSHGVNGRGMLSFLSDQSSLSSYEDDGSDAASADHMLRAGTSSPRSPAAATKSVDHFYPMLHKHGGGVKMKSYISSQEPFQKAQPSMARPSDKPQLPLELSSTHVSFPSSQRASTSRATRSNCRYRKISVPKEEDGPRVCFLVPGCSLGDQEVIEDNEIEDLGDATYADSLRMIRDIESLDFDLYLIGVLRQLVGVDLLREQEVFYLPPPGVEPIRKSRLRKACSDKSTSGKKASRSGNVNSSSALSSPRHPNMSVKAPSSKAGSISTSVSHPSRGPNSSTPPSSLQTDSSGDEGEETEDTERKTTTMRGVSEKSKTVAVPVERRTKRGKQIKRSRRLTSDALAYRPHSASEDESSVDDKISHSVRRKSMVQRGIKRTRSGKVFAEDADGRDTKKLKRDR